MNSAFLFLSQITEASMAGSHGNEVVPSDLKYQPFYTSNRYLADGSLASIDQVIADFEQRASMLDGFFNCGVNYDADWMARTHALAPHWVESFSPQVPDWRSIGSSYLNACLFILFKLKGVMGPAFDREMGIIDDLSQDTFRQTERSTRSLMALSNQQNERSIVAMPIQFGIRYRGSTCNRVVEMIDDRLDEAPLGVFSTALIILTHKEIVLDSGCLNVCCAGDERSPMGKESSFYQVPLFGVSTLSREDLKERSQLLSLGQSVPSSYGKKNLILSSRDKQYPPGKGDSFATLFLP